MKLIESITSLPQAGVTQIEQKPHTGYADESYMGDIPTTPAVVSGDPTPNSELLPPLIDTPAESTETDPIYNQQATEPIHDLYTTEIPLSNIIIPHELETVPPDEVKQYMKGIRTRVYSLDNYKLPSPTAAEDDPEKKHREEQRAILRVAQHDFGNLYTIVQEQGDFTKPVPLDVLSAMSGLLRIKESALSRNPLPPKKFGVEDVCQMVGGAWAYATHPLGIRVAYQSNIPRDPHYPGVPVVHGQEEYLTALVSTLVDNSQKAYRSVTDDRIPADSSDIPDKIISITVEPDRITIQDTGPGFTGVTADLLQFSNEDRPHAPQKLFDGGKSNFAVGGTGHGASGAALLTKLLGGKIHMSNVFDQNGNITGAQAEVFLPMSLGEVDQDDGYFE